MPETKKQVFKFDIYAPLERKETAETFQTFSVRMNAPHVMWKYVFKNKVEDEIQFKLAKAELKLAMIEALMNGEWDIHKHE